MVAWHPKAQLVELTLLMNENASLYRDVIRSMTVEQALKLHSFLGTVLHEELENE